jgi:hypothetical protein
LDEFSRNKLVEKMMHIVPEFVSMNSYYGNVKNGKQVNELALTKPILNTYSVNNKDVKRKIDVDEAQIRLK